MSASTLVAAPAALKSAATFISLRAGPGDDLLHTLTHTVAAAGARAAFIATCVGSFTHAHIRFANEPTGTRLGPAHFEIVSLVGTLSSDGSHHVHVCVCDGEGRAIGGHMLEGCLVYTTAEVVLGLLPDVAFVREPCPRSGWDELVVRPSGESA